MYWCCNFAISSRTSSFMAHVNAMNVPFHGSLISSKNLQSDRPKKLRDVGRPQHTSGNKRAMALYRPAATRAIRFSPVMLYNFYYCGICCYLPKTVIHTAFEAMTASKQPQATFDIIFDTSKLNYPGIYVHIA